MTMLQYNLIKHTRNYNMLTIIPKEEILGKLDSALVTGLADIVTIFPDFRQKVQDSLLWGIFSKEQPFEAPEKDKRYYSSFAYLSYDVVELARQELQKSGEKNPQFFFYKVDEVFKEKDAEVYLDYEDSDVLIEEVEKEKHQYNKDFQGFIALTLPDSGIVFDSLIEGNVYDDKNTWVLEYMDTYDAWRHDVMERLYRYVWQIGGHGRWIQSDYNDTYVAQANIDIGDAGSVFIEIRDKDIKGYVDMY